MSQENKISEDHLITLREFSNFFTSANSALGELVLKHESLKDSILSQVKAKNSDFTNFKKELETTYGKININIDTGFYTTVEEDTTENKN